MVQNAMSDAFYSAFEFLKILSFMSQMETCMPERFCNLLTFFWKSVKELYLKAGIMTLGSEKVLLDRITFL